jgi:flagellar biogenesis protein FliO
LRILDSIDRFCYSDGDLKVRRASGDFGEGHLKNFFFAVFLCAAVFSFGQDAPDGIPQEGAATDSESSDPETALVFDEVETVTNFGAGPSVFALLRVVLILGLVAVAIYGLVFLLKRQSAARVETDPYLKILARAAITPKTAAVVISLGDKAWLAGVTDEQVSLITEISDKEVVDAMLLDAANREIAAQSRRFDFRAMLAKLSGNTARSQSSGTSTTSGIRAQADRLGRL